MGKEVEIPANWPSWKVEIAGALNSSGFSMKEASVKAGLGETFVRDALKRDRKPGHENLMKLFAVLGLSVEALSPNVRPIVGLEVVGVTEAGAFRDATLSHKRRAMLDTIPVAKDARFDHAQQYALLVTGDSMDKIIEDGSFVTCVNFASQSSDQPSLLTWLCLREPCGLCYALEGGRVRRLCRCSWPIPRMG